MPMMYSCYWYNRLNCVLWLYLLVLRNISLSGAANVTIIRYIKEKRDLFSFNDSQICGKTGERHVWCKGKKAEQTSSSNKLMSTYPCSCQCQYNYETFLFDRKECVDIAYLKSDENFENGKYRLKDPLNLSGQGSIDIGLSCKGCKVDKVFYYMNSKWNISSAKAWDIQDNGVLTWESSNSHSELQGRILKIKLKECKTNRNDCHWKQAGLLTVVFLKAIGNYSKVVVIPTALPSSTQVTTALTSLPARTHLPYQVSSTAALILTSSYMPVTNIYSHSVCNVCTTPTSGHVPTKKSFDKRYLSTGAIVGIVFACIVVAGIIILLLIWRRCKFSSRENSSGNRKKPLDSTGNPVYGQNQCETIALPHREGKDTGDSINQEYDYAIVDGGHSDHKNPSKPIYQSLMKEKIRDSVYTPLSKEATVTPVEYSYNHLQHPQYNPPRSKSDPLYNTLEPPNNDEYLEPGTQINDNPTGVSEPVYNVLEGPDANPATQDNDPVYNVLEDPNADQYPQDNDPVYNVLEDPSADQYPQDNDPVYNVLEDPDNNYDNAPTDDDQNLPAPGQDNVAYSSTIDLNIPQSPSSPDYDVLEGPEGVLSDSTYQPLGIRVQDDVYQPLDRTSQPIYQSLEPSDSTA